MLSSKNKKDIERIRLGLKKTDSDREELVKRSRDIITLSKQLIYAVHRNSADAPGLRSRMQDDFIEFSKSAKKHPEIYYLGFFRVSAQEYVEAVAYYEYVYSRKIPTSAELGVEPEHYLLGLCDLTGELARKAIYSVINGDYASAAMIHSTVKDIYDQLMLFDFRNSDLRRKFDSIKYDLKKLDDLILELKLKRKL